MIYLFALIFLIIKSIKKWHRWKINEEKTGRAHIHMNWIWPQVCLWPLKTNTLWKSEPLWDCCSLQTRHPLWSKVRSFVSRHDIPPMRGHLLSIKRGCAEQIRGLNSKDQATDDGRHLIDIWVIRAKKKKECFESIFCSIHVHDTRHQLLWKNYVILYSNILTK